VREGAALGVLAGEPDRDPVFEERCERERLGMAPVDPALTQALVAAFQLTQQLWMDLESLGHLQKLLAELEKPLGGHGRGDGRAGVRLRGRLGGRYRRREARPQLVMR